MTAEAASAETYTRERVERTIGIVVGGACVFFGVQALVAAITADDTGVWRPIIMIAVFGALLLLIIGGLTGVGFRFAAGLFAILFAVVLALWAFIEHDAGDGIGGQPWIWYLINVATVSAVIAYPLPVQLAWTIGLPFVFATIRIIEDGGTQDAWLQNVFDMSFSLLLGAVIMILIWQFRASAAHADAQRQRTIETYAATAAAAAVDVERTELAGLLHDSVLSALIAAERARSPRERELAVEMARTALSDLANAEQYVEPGPDAPVDIEAVYAELQAAVSGMTVTARFSLDGHGTVPGTVARATTLAATQAIANAVQHAAARGLAVRVVGTNGGVAVAVRDTGPGMNLDVVPENRLGIRASIFARMRAVGGDAELTSDDRGTRVLVWWRP